jgi:hypothetical protein
LGNSLDPKLAAHGEEVEGGWDRDLIGLRTAVHWRIEPPFAPECEFDKKIQLLAECIAAQVREAIRTSDDGPWDYVVCTTYLSLIVVYSPRFAGALLDAIERGCGRRPLGILHTYECSGWGYALRFLSQHADSRKVLLTIADVDLHNVQWYSHHPLIGKSGFGITTLALTLHDSVAGMLECGGPYPNSAFKELIRAIRALHARCGKSPTFITFLTDGLAATARRLVGPDVLGPNRIDEYGHCFGSDSWIGIIERCQSASRIEREVVTVGTIAYNGYYALCNVLLSPETTTVFRRVEGSCASLTTAARGLKI